MPVRWVTHCPVMIPLCCHCCPLQVIRVQTTAAAEETAVLHLFEQLTVSEETAAPAPPPEAVAQPSSMSFADMRVCTLHQRSPIHMYMFDSRGRLLNANKAAWEGQQPGGQQPGATSIPACSVSRCLVSYGVTKNIGCNEVQPYAQWK